MPPGALPGVIPGAVGVGGAGAAGGIGGAGGASTAVEGAAQEAVNQLIASAAAGDLTGLEDYISKFARGTLRMVRQGKLNDTQADRVRSTLSGAKVTMAKQIAGGAVVIIENESGQVTRFRVSQEGGKPVISEMTLPATGF